MRSRMERYYKTGKYRSRMEKNQELYRTMYDVGEYTNIEGIASIEKTNQIDLKQIQELLRKVNNEEKKEIQESVATKEPTSISTTIESIFDDEEKSYDIKDVLNKAKSERKDTSSKHHNLDNTQYNILKKLKINENKDYSDDEKHELKELIHTIANTDILNKLEDRELSLDLISSLKAGEETLIREREEMEKELNKEDSTQSEKTAQLDNIDNSFFTSSLNFSEEDFEDLKDIGKTLKKNNLLIKILTILLVVIIISVAGYVAYTFFGLGT
ncbi:MAG: hypothetical protein GX190_03240 [Mollicutes bacterium]|nr:hypothetical protein [Mollicutes bacterium]